jgi:hypothetical protein
MIISFLARRRCAITLTWRGIARCLATLPLLAHGNVRFWVSHQTFEGWVARRIGIDKRATGACQTGCKGTGGERG